MKFGGICIETNDAPRLAAFYEIVFQEKPFVEGSHYGFGHIAIYDPGDVQLAMEKNIWLQCFADDLDKEYARLVSAIPDINVISKPERRPWGAYSCWLADPDGNKIALAENR